VFLWLGISSSTGLNYERAGKKRGSFKWKSKIARAIGAVNILDSVAFLSYSAILHLLQLLV
jgi:hypothetical protein